ncbi:hypothetical protein ACFL0L_02035 [Patescibacteria group bacterium]
MILLKYHTMLKTLKLSFTLFMLVALIAPTFVHAVFNPNFILSDTNLIQSTAMSQERIQSFLESQGSGLARYNTNVGPTQKSAAEIIYSAGLAWTINPQYLLVRLQVEQSLVTTSSPTQRQVDWATGYAVCDSCSTNDPAIQEYKGFYNQVNWAARRIRERYLPDLQQNGMTFTGWGPGITKTSGDGYAVTPANNATSALYTYTPYVYNANYNVWRLWNLWFTKHYPDGSLLQEESGGVWKIENGKRRPFLSRSAFFSRFDANQLIPVSLTDLEPYEIGIPIKFPNYALVQDPDGHVYLLDGYTKRRILSPEVFRSIGFNPEEIILGDEGDLDAYDYGDVISIESSHPSGILLQSSETGGITFVQNGVRHSIWSKEILNSQFRNRSITVVDEATILQYEKGDPVLFRDAELVTSPNHRSVFFISNGTKRPIISKDAFDELGFNWGNIIWTTDKALDIHPNGYSITTEE